MTFDGTNVDVDELAAFGKGMTSRAKETVEAADAVAGVHLGADMLGVFSRMFLDRAGQDRADVESNLRAVGSRLYADGADATAGAVAFEENNATQASRFTAEELP
jgi:hypothetical protein